MSLHNDINNLSKTIENGQKIITKQQKEAEKAKNKIYIAKIELLDDLKDELQHYLKYEHNILNSKIRNEIIDALLEYSNIIYNKNYTRAFLIENYEKEAKKILSTYEKEKKQLEKQQKEEERQREIAERAAQKAYIQNQKEKQIAYNNIIILLKSICWILVAPFLLIIFFVYGICKNIK